MSESKDNITANNRAHASSVDDPQEIMLIFF